MKNYFKAPIILNLQLFAEDEDYAGDDGFVDQEEFVEEDGNDLDDDSNLEDEGEIEEEDGTADHQKEENKSQSKRDNDIYKNMRLKAEQEIRTKLEAELSQEKQRITSERQQLEQERAEKKIRDEYLTQEKVWEKADEEGVTELQARKMLEYEVDKVIEREKEAVRSRFEQMQAQKKEASKDRFFKLLEKDIDNELAANPNSGVDFRTLYWFRRGERSDELDKQLASQVQKKTLADVQDRNRRRVSSDGGSDSPTDTSILSNQGLEMSNAFGIDPRKIANYVKQNTNKKRG